MLLSFLFLLHLIFLGRKFKTAVNLNPDYPDFEQAIYSFKVYFVLNEVHLG